jgi:CBS domain-containing protein
MQQLTIYIKETDHVQRKPLFLEILNYVKANSGAGATVLRGIAGYSSSSRSITTAGLADVQQKLPLVIIIVDLAWRIELMLPQIEGWVHVNGGLVTVQDLEAHRYLHPNLPQGVRPNATVKVADIMARHVVTVRPTDSAANVVSMLLGKYYKSLPVIDRDNRLVGMITDGDLMEKGKLPFRLSILEALEASGERGYQEILEELRSSHMTAQDLMGSRDIVTLSPHASALDAARLMIERKVKRIPVVDESGHLIGILGRLDILKSAGTIFPNSGIDGEGAAERHASTITRLDNTLDPGVPVVTADTSMHNVVEMLVKPPGPRRIIVVDSLEQKRVVGIIADRDVVMRAHVQSRPGLLRMLREGLSPHHLTPEQQEQSGKLSARTAADIMSLNVVVAPAAMPLGEAVRLMVQREIKLLPVVDHGGRLLGAVGRMGILQALVQGEERSSK